MAPKIASVLLYGCLLNKAALYIALRWSGRAADAVRVSRQTKQVQINQHVLFYSERVLVTNSDSPEQWIPGLNGG